MAGQHHNPAEETWLLRSYVAGKIDLVELLDKLCEIAIPGRYDPTGGDGYLQGTIDSLWRAVVNGTLGPADWSVVLRRAEDCPALLATSPLPAEASVEGDQSCRCIRFPDETGRLLPQAWVAAHEEVRVVGLDGRVATGWTMGLDEATTPYGPELFLEVEVPGSDSVTFTADEIATCTPVSGITDADPFLDAVRDAVAHAIHFPDEQASYCKLIRSAHSEIEVTIKYATHQCMPITHP